MPDPCPKNVYPCGIELYSPCPPYVRAWRRNTICPNDYLQFAPSPDPDDCEQQPCRFAIYVGNENAITDDDMRVLLNGVEIAQLFEVDLSCEQTLCRGHLVLPASLGGSTPGIVGGGGSGLEFCARLPIDLKYYYSAALDALPPAAINIVELRTLNDNNCGNYGRFVIFQVCIFDGVMRLQPVRIGLYSSRLHEPLNSRLAFPSECDPCCRTLKRQPAKGVKLHVLIPKVDVFMEEDGVLRKFATDVASYVLYFDSHGKLDHVEFACPKVKLTTATDLSCSSCDGSSGSKQLVFAPGIFYELTCDELGRACPVLTCCQE